MQENSAQKKEARDVWKAGLLTLLGLGAIAGFVALIGQKQHFFEKTVHYSIAFRNVEGLQVESPVWLGGLEVGRVEGLSLLPRADEKCMNVQVEILKDYEAWVKEDSRAKITSRGLLGDKAIDISLGNSASLMLPTGSEIPSLEAENLDGLMHKAGELLQNSIVVSDHVKKGVAAFFQPSLLKDVHATVRGVREVVEEVKTGNGLAHALLYDASTRKNVEAVVAEAQQGMAGFRRAADHLADATEDVEVKRLLADLQAAAEDLKVVTSKVRQGEGTVGGLIQDPTVYEDLKQVLNNLRRNRILRAMVRFLVTNGEGLEQAGKVETPPKASMAR